MDGLISGYTRFAFVYMLATDHEHPEELDRVTRFGKRLLRDYYPRGFPVAGSRFVQSAGAVRRPKSAAEVAALPGANNGAIADPSKGLRRSPLEGTEKGILTEDRLYGNPASFN